MHLLQLYVIGVITLKRCIGLFLKVSTAQHELMQACELCCGSSKQCLPWCAVFGFWLATHSAGCCRRLSHRTSRPVGRRCCRQCSDRVILVGGCAALMLVACLRWELKVYIRVCWSMGDAIWNDLRKDNCSVCIFVQGANQLMPG